MSTAEIGHAKRIFSRARLVELSRIYLFLLPWFALFVLYTLAPIVSSWYYAFLDWSGFEASGTFVGLANFKAILQDDLFWNAIGNTFLFVATAAPLRFVAALLLAVILNGTLVPSRGVFRTLIFTPVVTTGAIIGIIMGILLDPGGGPINTFLVQIGLLNQPINFLATAETAFPTAVGIWSWKWLGVTLVYWLAALQTIPNELYEAGIIDGAGPVTLFTRITIPLLLPFAAIIFLITAVEATRVFDLLLTLTGGGPYFSTEVIEIFIYRWAFQANVPRLGYASAGAAIFGLMFMFLTLSQAGLMRLAQRKRKV